MILHGIQYGQISGPVDVIASDFNNDGELDMTIACSGDQWSGSNGYLDVFINLGGGVFDDYPYGNPNYIRLWTGGVDNPKEICNADFNNDGTVDIVYAGESGIGRFIN